MQSFSFSGKVLASLPCNAVALSTALWFVTRGLKNAQTDVSLTFSFFKHGKQTMQASFPV